ncbi:hypothetical protein [Methylotuvimicrobium sp. KM2]|uniref:hypothetical protein n=1 Tax=Methylotuvimicrobium sp. KM2 TaxID=3133976 RepID=UPI003100E276
MVRLSLCVVFVLSLTACAVAKQHTDIKLISFDDDTRYGTKETEDGFDIELYYSRYQFIPESDAVAMACKNQLTSAAWRHAEKLKKEIEPVNEQRIRISMGRNGVTGITSCRAFVPVRWKQPQ